MTLTVLPIVERELRVRARSAAGYRGRFGIGLIGIIVCVPTFVSPPIFRSAANMGSGSFYSLVGTAFLVCCGASLLTADVISRERREGTLGLLLLTRVRGFDVVLGTLSSAGLASVSGLVALLPVLMIPVLAGGVTGGEVLRESLALLNALFFALAVGLWGSAMHIQRARAVRIAVAILIAFSLFPLSCFAFVLAPLVYLTGASPLMTVIAASDTTYRGSPGLYWGSLVVVQGITWLFIRGAAKKMRLLRTEEGLDPDREFRQPSRPGIGLTTAQRAQLPWPESGMVRTQLANRRWSPAAGISPVEWLVRRQRGLTPLLWAGTLIGFFHYASYLLYRPFMGWSAWAIIGSLPGLAVAVLSGACFAFVASRFFMEARRSGELELLLATPLGARSIIVDQWKALERLMAWPAIFLIGLILLRLLPLFTANTTSLAIPLYILLSAGMGLVNTVAGLAAICWVGLWFGLKARNQTAAVLWTAGLAKGLPYLFGIIISLLVRLVLAPFGNPAGYASPAGVLVPAVMVLLCYLWLIRLVRRRLGLELAGAEL